jgi:peptide/nickel transport system permease protein
VNNFLRLIGRRLVALPIMALGVTVLVFFLMSFSKTDPAYTALGDGASPEAVAEYHEKYGLDDPWPVRYVRYMGDLIHGDMGTYGACQAHLHGPARHDAADLYRSCHRRGRFVFARRHRGAVSR